MSFTDTVNVKKVFKKSHFNRKNLIRFSLIAALSGFFFLFQNCGELGTDQGEVRDLIRQSYMEGLPFAYSVQLDMLAYSSCLAGRPFHFKASSFANAPSTGISLRPSFIEAIEMLETEQKKEALIYSTINANRSLSFAIRDEFNMQVPMTFGEAGNIGRAFYDKNRGLSLDSVAFSDPLIDALELAIAPNGLNYISSTPNVSGTNLDLEIRLSNSAATGTLGREATVTRCLASSGCGPNDTSTGNKYLVLGYSPNAVSKRLIGPGDDSGRAEASKENTYGIRYKVNFSQSNTQRSSSPNRKMFIQFGEKFNGTDWEDMNESWDCDSLSFTVVRPSDANKEYFNGEPAIGTQFFSEVPTEYHPDDPACSALPDTALGQGNSTDNDDCPTIEWNGVFYERFQQTSIVCPLHADDPLEPKYDLVRKVLPASDWYVHIDNDFPHRNCIVQKNRFDSCYGLEETTSRNSINQKLPIQYFEEQTASLGLVGFDGNCGNGTRAFCPHSLNICVRNDLKTNF